MEVEIVNRKKGSRIIQQKGGPGGQAHIVDNRANPVQGLMLNRNVAQRVIQRENEANGKFVYVENSGAPDFLIPYLPNTIQFTSYQGGEIRSAGFTGCFMMAFRFNSERVAEVKMLFPKSYPGLDYNDTYVAHVDNKEKKAVFDALKRELIIIEAMFRPFNNNTSEIKIKRKDERFTAGHAGLKNRTGAMTRTQIRTPIKEARWKSAVYSEERIPARKEDRVGAFSTSIFGRKHNEKIQKRLDELDALGAFARNEVPWKYYNTLLMNYSESEMEVHTQASIAYICARAYMESTVPEEREKADEMVRGISPKAIKMARDVYSNEDGEGNVWAYLNNYC